LELKAVTLTDEVLAAADCVVILTDHAGFDYADIAGKARAVIDSRNATWGIAAPDERIVRL
jgi:UDP-N-acetyl-D-glucosamine dehydrogenase